MWGAARRLLLALLTLSLARGGPAAADDAAAPLAPAGSLVIDPAPAGLAPASDFRVEVDGREVFVHDTPVAAVATFAFAGEVTVRITPRADPRWVDVRPLAANVRPLVRGGVIEFKLARPARLSVELNRKLKRPLFLFADAPEVDPPRPGDAKVRYFEGGRVHDAGVIEVGSDETVYLAGGAVVRGMIRASNARNVRVAGRGVFVGTGNRELRQDRWSHFMSFRDCQDVRVEGVTLLDSTTWQIVPVNCDRVTLRNVKVVSGNGGDDGTDVVRSRDVTIEDCFYRTKDDCVAIKAHGDYPPEVGVERVRVSRCVFWNAEWGNAVEIGFELRSAHVRDVVFRDCDVIHVDGGAALSIHNADAATVSDVRFEDIRVEDCSQMLVDLAIFLSQYSVDRPADPAERQRRYLHGAWDGVLSVDPATRAEHARHRGQIRGVLFKDVRVVDGPIPFSLIAGFDDEHRVDDVVFDNLTFHGKKVMSAEDAKLVTEHAGRVTFK